MMTPLTRREMLGVTGLLATASWRGGASARPLGLPIGLQPYTVRREMQQDCEGTLRKIAAIGYQDLEIGDPFYGQEPSGLRKLLKSLGMATSSGHYGYPKDTSEWAKSIDHAKSFGVKYMITSAPQEWRKSLDGWKRAAERFNELGAQCRKAGVAVAYHNHHFEYVVLDGKVAYDEFLRLTDPKLVLMELDCFWTTFAGKDPVAYFEKYPGRFPLLHIKDLKPGFPPSTDSFKGKPYAEVGKGIIDWKRIFQAAPKGGIKQYYVEQDECDRSPIESIRISYDYLKNLNV
jgi:sugar phosphate isomerase/epimerase